MKNGNKIFYIIILIFLGLGCKKESLKQETFSEPTLYVRGNLNGDTLDFTAGQNLITSSTYNIEVDTFRYFNFQFERKDNWGIPSLEIRFNNYKSPYSDLKSDLENTLKVKSYNYTESGFPGGDLYQFSKITITYIDSLSYIYTSKNNYHNIGNFSIYKTEKTIAKNNKMYLKIYIHFDCILNNSNKYIQLKNGEAVIAFEY